MKFGHPLPPRQQPPPPPPMRQRQEAPPELRKAPRPYSWKTDEFKVKGGSARQTSQIERMPSAPAPGEAQLTRPFAGNQGQAIAQGYHCPRCMSPAVPHATRKISSAGWIVFAVLLVFFFPLFWVGLLIKEDVVVCPVCDYR
ncbi:MAG: hypothetical protein OEM82_12690, partial [Acidobacteriota bacterium]|nr:hypothetical protein [Acidobacteriota bacterium]